LDENLYKIWVNNIKVGDEVAVELDGLDYHGHIIYRICNVTKILSGRRIFVSFNNIKFVDGKAVNVGMFTIPRRIVPVTDEIRAKVERETLLTELFGFNLGVLTTEQLKEVHKIWLARK
jgi:hypothetical protein